MSTDTTIKEICTRVTRIETRIITLAEGLGVNLKEDDRITVDGNDVTISAMDVTLSNVCRIARQAGLHGQRIRVVYKDEVIAEFKV